MTKWGVIGVAVLLLVGGVAGTGAEALGDSPDIWYEYGWEMLTDSSLTPHVIITGEITNKGDGAWYNGRVTATLRDEDGVSITSRSVIMDQVPAQTSQKYYFKVELTKGQAQRFDYVNITTRSTSSAR